LFELETPENAPPVYPDAHPVLPDAADIHAADRERASHPATMCRLDQIGPPIVGLVAVAMRDLARRPFAAFQRQRQPVSKHRLPLALICEPDQQRAAGARGPDRLARGAEDVARVRLITEPFREPRDRRPPGL
jgi:hypothetical protein